MKNIRLGDVLIEFGYITPDQLNTALAYQKEHRDLRVGQALQELGYAGEIYGRPAAEFADEVIAAARAGLSDNERGFLEPLEKLVAARTTLADRE